VVVQTLAPDNAAVRLAALGDYESFVRVEDAHRASLGYPPHGRLCRVLFEDRDEARVVRAAKATAEELLAYLGPSGPEVLGPAPAAFARLRGRHRHHVLVKARLGDPAFERALAWLLERSSRESRPAIKLDVDPASMM